MGIGLCLLYGLSADPRQLEAEAVRVRGAGTALLSGGVGGLDGGVLGAGDAPFVRTPGMERMAPGRAALAGGRSVLARHRLGRMDVGGLPSRPEGREGPAEVLGADRADLPSAAGIGVLHGVAVAGALRGGNGFVVGLMHFFVRLVPGTERSV